MAPVSALRVLPGGRSGNDPGPAVKTEERALPASPVAKASRPEHPVGRGLLAELYEKHAPAVYARCRYLLRDDDEAKDALQEVFAKALRALSGFRSAASPTT